MSRIWTFIHTHFLTKKFITFGLIGIVNTLIHLVVYGIFYQTLSVGAFLSNTAAFITASVFSYFANAYLTFKPQHKTATQFSVVLMVFVIRLVVSGLLTSLFDFMMLEWFMANYEATPILTYVAPFVASALLIPIAYFALDIVFKKTSDLEEQKNNK